MIELTKVLDDGLQFVQVRLVLPLVLDLLLDTLEDPHRRRVVVDLPSGLQGLRDDLRVGHEVVGKTVVEPPLEFKQVGAV